METVAIKKGCVIRNKETGKYKFIRVTDLDTEFPEDEWEYISDRAHDHEEGKFSYMCNTTYCRCQA